MLRTTLILLSCACIQGRFQQFSSTDVNQCAGYKPAQEKICKLILQISNCCDSPLGSELQSAVEAESVACARDLKKQNELLRSLLKMEREALAAVNQNLENQKNHVRELQKHAKEAIARAIVLHENKLANLERTAQEAENREQYLAKKQRQERKIDAEKQRVRDLDNLLANFNNENNNLTNHFNKVWEQATLLEEEIETQREIADSCGEPISNTNVRLEVELNQTKSDEFKMKFLENARIGNELASASGKLDHQMELAQASPTEVTTKTPAVAAATKELDATLATGIYYFNPHFMSWEMARSVCRSKGMDLVAIESPEENEAIVTHSRTLGDWIWAWTSACLSWETQDEIWLSTNQIVAYTNWGRGEPDRGKRDCIQLNIENGTWHDYIKLDKVSSICEFTRA